MVYDLPFFGCQIQATVHLVIVKGPDAGCTQPKGLGGEAQALANSAGFEMDIAITTVFDSVPVVPDYKCGRTSDSRTNTRENACLTDERF